MKIQVLLVILWLVEYNCHTSPQSHEEDKPRNDAFKEKFYWGMLKFKFPNASARHVALSTGSYIPGNNNVWAIGLWESILFVSIFRFGLGVVSSFNYFSMKTETKSPVLIPYPSYDANYVNEDPEHKTVALPKNSSIISAGYFRIDRCDRLWVIDSGLVDLFGNVTALTPPAIVIFNLKTNKLIRRYPLPDSFVNSNTVFVNLDIDFKGDGCDDAFAYIVDMFRSIVVYSLKNDRSWRLTHNLFGSDPRSANFYYDRLNFQWNFGVLGLTIGEHCHNGSKRVYINPFASTKSYYISNKVLQDEKYINENKYYYDLHLLGDRGNKGQIFTWEYDAKTKVLFDTQFNRQRITCWNTDNSYKNSSFAVVYKKSPIFFPNDLIIDKHRNLWIFTNNLPVFLYGAWNPKVKNIRLFKANLDDVISGTVCAPKFHKHQPHH